jgi:RES domain-containing protein
MKPTFHGAREGRANPKGIPVLYLASDNATAVAETRPWIGAHVSVGEFATTREVAVVDCSSADSLWWPSDALTAEELEEAAWGHMNDAFSRPITPSDDHASYLATQLLVEAFRREGFDGVIYRSSCGPGKCFALFNVTDADLCRCEVRVVKKIMLEHSVVVRSYEYA